MPGLRFALALPDCPTGTGSIPPTHQHPRRACHFGRAEKRTGIQRHWLPRGHAGNHVSQKLAKILAPAVRTTNRLEADSRLFQGPAKIPVAHEHDQLSVYTGGANRGKILLSGSVIAHSI